MKFWFVVLSTFLFIPAVRAQVVHAQRLEDAMYCYDNHDYDGALSVFVSLGDDVAKSNPDTFYCLARCVHKSEHAQDATRLFKELVQKFPTSSDAKKAQVILDTGRIPEESARLTKPITRHYIDHSRKLVQIIIPMHRHNMPSNNTPPPYPGGVFNVQFDSLKPPAYNIDVEINGRKTTAIFRGINCFLPDTGCTKKCLDKLGIALGNPVEVKTVRYDSPGLVGGSFSKPMPAAHGWVTTKTWHPSVDLSVSGTNIRANIPLVTEEATFESLEGKPICIVTPDQFTISAPFFRKRGDTQIDYETDELIFTQREGFVKAGP